MEKELKRIAVLQTGKMLAILYAFVGLFMLPFMLIAVLVSLAGHGGVESLLMMAPMAIMIVFYPIMGFVGGILLAALYNLVAKWVGGLRFTVE